jgi:cobalamin biosynthesis protein CobT
LAEEGKNLASKVEAEIQELLHAKESALKLQNLLAMYEQRLNKNNLSQLRLSDEVTMKNLLRDKLQREMQGFRTSPSEYKELEAINPDDITTIIRDIKGKLGN